MRESKTICWAEVLEKINTQAWASALIEAIKQDFESHVNAWPKDPPMAQSEWEHYYFCNNCGARLFFDITKPHAHKCPKCSTIFTGSPYDGVWCTLMHSTILSAMECAAILAHLPDTDEKYKKYIHDTILFYANNYDKYLVHGKHAGKGKIYPQVLDESIFIIGIERILRMTADLDIFSESEYKTIGELFFRPALDLIKPQVFFLEKFKSIKPELRTIHNIISWIIAAIAACANFLNDKELLKEAIYGEHGWLDQLEKGTTEEGIWYEISSSYHYYTLNSLLSLAWIALENDINLFEQPTLKKMASNYALLAYPDGKFPAFNDGWFNSNIFEKVGIYEQLARFEPSFQALLAWMYENMSSQPYGYLNALLNNSGRTTGYARASLSALIYGPVRLPDAKPPMRKSFLLKDTGIAVLQNDNLRVTLKSTGDGGGHDHNDKNSIELYAYDELISYDVGTSGYGIPFTKEWSRTPVAHNMVCINGQSQKNSKAEILNFNGQTVCAQANEAYEGVSLERSITLKEKGFEDIYRVKCDKESQIDWIFHCKGEIETDLPLTGREPFTEGNGYDQLFDLKHAIWHDEFSISFILSKGKRLDMSFAGEDNTEVIIGKCYGADKNDILSFVMLRRKNVQTTFYQRTTIEYIE